MQLPGVFHGRRGIRLLTTGLVLSIATVTGGVAQPAAAADRCSGDRACVAKRYDGAWHHASFRASDAVQFADTCSTDRISVSFTVRYRYDRATENFELGHVYVTNRTPRVNGRDIRVYLDNVETPLAASGIPTFVSKTSLGYLESDYLSDATAGRHKGVVRVPSDRDPFFYLMFAIKDDHNLCLAAVTGWLVTAKSAGSIPR